MGAYLSHPKTEKETLEGGNDRLRFAATSMQGWRLSQEDAHNCLVDLAGGWSLFAVYDGHGGSEVSQYTSQMFPVAIRESQFESATDATTLLQEVFIKFDDHLRSDDAKEKMQGIIDNVEKNKGSTDDESGEAEALLEEAGIPVKDILARLGLSLNKKPWAHKKRARQNVKSDLDVQDEDEAKRAKLNDNEESSDSIDVKQSEGDSGTGGDEPKINEDPAQGIDGSVGEGDDADDDTSDEDFEDESADTDDSEDVSDEDDSAETGSNADEEESDDDTIQIDDDAPEEAAEGLIQPSMLAGGNQDHHPGVDSGTTACLCLLNPEKIVVANIGDSRAVLSRSGVALDLSTDHKPDDELEKERILAAGGMISDDGRVCGGLNLSRALGDHYYKKNKEIPLSQQMITALPDVQIRDRTKDDEFIIVACDGIWNSMGSQSVIDFIRDRMNRNMPLKQIVEELCDSCMAETTDGDGTGCDNMTAIIIDLRPTSEDFNQGASAEQGSKVET